MKHNFLYIFKSIIVAVAIGVALLLLVYTLPVTRIRGHIHETKTLFQKEGDYPELMPGIISSKLDNFTDSLMMNEAAFLGTGSIIEDAMMNNYVVYPDVKKFSDSLLLAIESDSLGDATITMYPRYWHGYLVILKPLLLILNYSEIRYLNMCIQIILLMTVLWMIGKKLGARYAIAFLMTVFAINPVATAMSLQFSAVYYITLIASIWVLKLDKEVLNQHYWRILLWSGISVAYFDLLTYPLVALGIPLILVITLTDNSIHEDIKKIVFGASCIV